jgi:hypothetical protein
MLLLLLLHKVNLSTQLPTWHELLAWVETLPGNVAHYELQSLLTPASSSFVPRPQQNNSIPPTWHELPIWVEHLLKVVVQGVQ